MGMDDRPEQMRPAIIKGEGGTHSERHLARLAEISFLNLWSYPSPFRNQKQSGKGDGKELCDLLVVCGDVIIVFSEKTISWPSGELNVAWRRWSKRAISDASRQAKGAERWITEHPDRIFLDRDCTVPFPISLPEKGSQIIHHVIVVKGASEECRKHVGSGSGSLLIKPEVVGEAHWKDSAQPFAIGDVEPSGSFCHVFDDVGLNFIMKELDTITDFTDYLEKRAAFIRSGRLREAHGEESLLAYYAVRINDKGDHDFVDDGVAHAVTITRHHYDFLTKNPRYIAKKAADQVSYLWDNLIEIFTKPMLDGTSITLDGYEFDLKKNEIGARHMALLSRFARQCNGEAVRGALTKGISTDRFFRMMLGTAGSKGSETAFFIMTLKYLDWMEEKGGYEHYRLKRSELAEVYARGLLERFPYL